MWRGPEGPAPDGVEQAERLQHKLQEVEAKNRHYTELNTLLKEELAWFKSQVYGRSSEKSSSNSSAMGAP